MKPVILLTGKNGQVGSALCRLLPTLGEVVAPDRRGLDLLNPDSIRSALRRVRPRFIVNAAAYTAVDAAETDEPTAQALNAVALVVLAEEAKQLGATLIHYSTDYVFDGSKTTPYQEDDEPNPLNVYGKTKLAGEQAIRSSGASHLIFRTAWVYATRGRNFLLTILRLAAEREELKVVCDQTGTPTCSADIAAATVKILTQLCQAGSGKSANSGISGTYHMTAAGETTWYEFAKTILQAASRMRRDVSWFTAATRGLPLIAHKVVPITTKEFASVAPRPAYSILSNSRLTQTFGIELPDWHAQLEDCFAHNDQAVKLAR